MVLFTRVILDVTNEFLVFFNLIIKLIKLSLLNITDCIKFKSTSS